MSEVFLLWGDNIRTVMIFALFSAGLFCIIRGGDRFVDAAASIARLSGIPPFVIGATVVSVATTLPELLVSVMAAASGQPDMAAGNAIGSVTANTALILGLSALIAPSSAGREYLKKSLYLFAAIILLWAFSLTGELRLFGAVIMLILFVLYTCQSVAEAKAHRLDEPAEDSGDAGGMKAALSFIIGAAAIIIGSRLLVDNGTLIARDILNVDERVISLTMLAVGTSLPELVTAISAISKGQSSLTAGNILGANIIDTLLILPVCSLVSGGLPVDSAVLYTDLPMCLLASVIMLAPALIRGRFSRVQGGVSIVLYLIYMTKISLPIVF